MFMLNFWRKKKIQTQREELAMEAVLTFAAVNALREAIKQAKETETVDRGIAVTLPQRARQIRGETYECTKCGSHYRCDEYVDCPMCGELQKLT